MKLMWSLATTGDVSVRERARRQGYKRYVGSSVKGAAVIDWSNRRGCRMLLAQVVADADHLLEFARQVHDELPVDGRER